MSEKNNNSSNGGIGFAGLLTVAFIVLKLCGVIAWSWWWVLSPIWISFLFVIAILIVIGIIYLFLEK
jgi:Flp pilus assembly protein TadB